MEREIPKPIGVTFSDPLRRSRATLERAIDVGIIGIFVMNAIGKPPGNNPFFSITRKDCNIDFPRFDSISRP
jgi:hypothetical protein